MRFTSPIAAALLRAALVVKCCCRDFPSFDFLAVCFVRSVRLFLQYLTDIIHNCIENKPSPAILLIKIEVKNIELTHLSETYFEYFYLLKYLMLSKCYIRPYMT